MTHLPNMTAEAIGDLDTLHNGEWGLRHVRVGNERPTLHNGQWGYGTSA
jgi:hypothetical protein